MARKRLGELLLERGIVNRDQLEQALSYQRQTGHRLGAAMVALGFLTELQLAAALGTALGLKAVRMPPEPEQLDWSALHTLRARFCEANDLFPVGFEATNPGSNRKTLMVAMADPLNIPAIEEMEFTTGMKVVPLVAPLSGVRAAIRRYYLKQSEAPQPKAGRADQMTIIRSGGHEAVVSTSTSARAGARPPAAPQPSVAPQAPIALQAPVALAESDEDLPEIEVEPHREVTERTALADLIRDRVERKRRKSQRSSVDNDLDYLFGQADTATEALQKMEVRFWALLRIMAKKGLLTRDEFLNELADKEE